MYIVFALTLLLTTVALAGDPLFRVLDLNIGEKATAEFPKQAPIRIQLIATRETRDTVRGAIREARIEITVDGTRATLSCGNYHLPVTVGPAQVDCPVTKAYYKDSNADHWALEKDARVRVWPAGSPWMPPGSFLYPARQRWFATRTQMANEPTYVDGGERMGQKRIYYHSGLDIGGAEGMVDVIAATGGLVVGLGKAVVDSEKNNTMLDRRFDETIWVLDSRGWYHRYTHLYSFDPSVKLGGKVSMGQKIGTLGKEGTSGGWSHLHYEILGPQASGKLGTVEGYAFLWEAYQRQVKPRILAVARPHRAALIGERVRLDASLSFSQARIVRFDWTFSNGEKASGPTIERIYSKAGTYSEILKITDSAGRTDYDFLTVDILDPQQPNEIVPSIQAAFWPTTGISPGQEITFQTRTFGTTNGQETWDFGDGSTATTKSDGNVVPLAKTGFAITKHAFRRPGDYIVRVERANQAGHNAITHILVRVGRAGGK